MLRLKIHEAYRRIVALSDPELIGKRFEEGQLQLEIKNCSVEHTQKLSKAKARI